MEVLNRFATLPSQEEWTSNEVESILESRMRMNLGVKFSMIMNPGVEPSMRISLEVKILTKTPMKYVELTNTEFLYFFAKKLANKSFVL
jgi:hypothetical protein